MSERLNWVIGPNGYYNLVINLNSIYEVKPYKRYVKNFDFKVKRVDSDSLDYESYPNFITFEELESVYKYGKYRKRIWVQVPYGGSYPILVPVNFNGDYEKPEIISFEVFVEELNAVARITLNKQDSLLFDENPRLNFIVNNDLYYINLIEGEDFFNVIVNYETYHMDYDLLYL